MTRHKRDWPPRSRTMENDEPRSDNGFLADVESQLLCLQDALATRCSRTMVHALRAVTQVRGLFRSARDVGYDPAAFAALLDRSPSDAELRPLMATLIAHLSAGGRSANAEKSDNE